MRAKGSNLWIYDEVRQAGQESFLLEDMTDEEADAELERLEAAYARFLDGEYRLWQRKKQYRFDRRGLLYQCLLGRGICREARIAGYKGLSEDDRLFVLEAQNEKLTAAQMDLLKLRISYYLRMPIGVS